jgi:hypothetical protein
VQGDDEQEAEGDGGAGAELRQLQPPAPQGAASGAQQLCRGLSGELLKTLPYSYLCPMLTTLLTTPFFQLSSFVTFGYISTLAGVFL